MHADQMRALSRPDEAFYGARRVAYDLKKLRGKQIVCRIAKTQRYEPIPHGLRNMVALVVLRDKVIKPLLATSRQDKPGRGAESKRHSIPTTKPPALARRVSSTTLDWPHDIDDYFFRALLGTSRTRYRSSNYPLGPLDSSRYHCLCTRGAFRVNMSSVVMR